MIRPVRCFCAGIASPRFYVDEAALPTGVTSMTALAVDYLVSASST